VATAEEVTGEAEGTATVADNTVEASTIVADEDATEAVTTVKPGNGHATDESEASNDTATVVSETTDAGNDTTTEVSGATGAATLETSTIGTNYIILFSNGMVCARRYQKNDDPVFSWLVCFCFFLSFLHVLILLLYETIESLILPFFLYILDDGEGDGKFPPMCDFE
jgi:hypothetical protein